MSPLMEKAAYYQTDDDADAKTADEIFETHQRVFKVKFDPSSTEIVTDPKRDVDILISPLPRMKKR
ncbi:hypothetical protein RCO48_24475 [Peribacillus frigoritolerans]|nr:hypothetical protein [Peribacillus frigoritolerans]